MHKFIILSLSVLALFSFSDYAVAQSATEKKDTMYMNKSAEFNYETSSGIITLENFVPGEMQKAQDAKPLDALLILDYSSSMTSSYGTKEDFTETYVTTRYRAKDLGVSDSDASGDKSTGLSVTYKGASYSVRMTHCYNSSHKFKTCDWLYITVGGNRVYVRPDRTFVIPKNNDVPTNDSWPTTSEGYPIEPILAMEMIWCDMATRTTSTTTRGLAMMKAVNEFLDMVYDHANKSNKKNRVSLVSFQSSNSSYLYTTQYNSETSSSKYVTSGQNCYLTEKYHDYKWNGSNWTTQQNNNYGKSGVLKRWIDITDDNALTALKRNINDIHFASQTPHDAGAYIGQQLMIKSRSTEATDNVARFVIYFSDGVPTGGSSTDFDSNVANRALATTDAMKKAYPDAKFYSIYCNTKSISGDQLAFMQKLSSDYKDATSLSTGTRVTSEDKYYKWAKEDLSVIFKEIAEEIIVESSSKYDINTTLNDFVNNEYFQLPDGATQDDIFVIENKCTGYVKSTNTYSWAAEDDATKTKRLTEADGIEITITKGNRTLPKTDPGYNDRVSISGYDYGKNWCGMDISKTPNVAHGARLIVKIPFVYTTTQVWGDLPTNSTDSGVTVVDPETHKEVEDKKYPVPTLPFCYIKLKRAGLHEGESAIYLIEKPNTSGGYDFVDKVVINGEGSGLDSCALYGVPGETFRITETNWNWAYHKTLNPQEKTVDKSIKPYEVLFEFTGEHKVPDPSLSEHEKEKDPANLHNHDEAFKVNHLSLPLSPDLAPRPDAIEPKNGYELLPCPYFRE